MNKDKFLLRRQYVLGPKYLKRHSKWYRYKISDGLFLTVHPDLQFTKKSNNGKIITLLGYILDPYNPAYSNSQILEAIIEKVQSADDIFSIIENMCGRFVIVVQVNEELRIFSDAGGLRQVFYSIDELNQLWCASQPTIIAEQLHLNIDVEIKRDLYNTTLFSKTQVYWYPGNITLFREVLHLAPNHFIDMKNKSVNRYWPKKPLKPISINECVEKTTELLSGIFKSAHNRFNNLSFAISSGLDSRLLLAASKKYSSSIHYFTHARGKNGYEGVDVKIPMALLKKLGLKHSVLDDPENIDEEFEKILKNNVLTARKRTGIHAFSIYKNFHSAKNDLVVVFGNVSEVSKRDRYRWPCVSKTLIWGRSLTAMADMTKSKTALKEFRAWLKSVKWVTKYNVNILDLMHWEQRVGNWASMALSEYDIAFESLCPYSCRAYIEYMLRVPFKYRTMPDYTLHKMIVQNLWPETLDFKIVTINSEENKYKRSFVDLLYKTYLYDYLKYFYLMIFHGFK